jgi:hypothetical protein
MLEVKNPGEFLDPWGKRYRIAWDLYDASGSASDPKDTPYDGKVGKAYVTGLSVPYPTSLNDRNYVYASYVIWSLGSDKAESATAAQEVNRDNVYSVETVWSAGTGHDIR